MSKETKTFIEKTIDAWQPGYKRKLTSEDARQIAENMNGFFNTLMEWEKNERVKNTPDKKSGLHPEIAIH